MSTIVIPKFELNLVVDNQIPVGNSFVFDIYLRKLDATSSFEFAGGQYFIDFNREEIVPLDKGLELSIEKSDLPVNMQPRNPTVLGSQLRFAVNTFPGIGSGFMNIEFNEPGTLIARARIILKEGEFLERKVILNWRTKAPNPFTKLFGYINGINTDLSGNCNYQTKISAQHN